MKKTIYFYLLSIAIVAIISCKPSKEKKIEKISVLEKELLSDKVNIDTSKAEELILLYKDYADNFKSDSLSPEFLLKAADISMNLSKGQQAIDLLDKILTDFKQYYKTPDCLFLKAYILENQLNDLKNAEKTYKEFLEKYPNHAFAISAKSAIENLGIPADVLIKKFEEQNKSKKDSLTQIIQ